MKCLDCPLCISDYCAVCGGGCRRTNKFIFAQDKKKLKDEWAEEEARHWAEMTDWFEQQEKGGEEE